MKLRQLDAMAREVAKAPVYAWDDQLAGFGIKVLPSGRRKYVCKYRVGGGRGARDRWFLIGTHGQLTCDQAREIAMQILSAVARGEDPQSDRLAAREAPTLSDFWNRYSAEHLPRKKASSRIDDNQKARDYILPRLGRRKLAEITRADVHDLHRELADRPYQANRVLALLSKMLNLAEAWLTAPTHAGISKNTRSKRGSATSAMTNCAGSASRLTNSKTGTRTALRGCGDQTSVADRRAGKRGAAGSLGLDRLGTVAASSCQTARPARNPSF
jgi:hypothetical protein